MKIISNLFSPYLYFIHLILHGIDFAKSYQLTFNSSFTVPLLEKQDTIRYYSGYIATGMVSASTGYSNYSGHLLSLNNADLDFHLPFALDSAFFGKDGQIFLYVLSNDFSKASLDLITYEIRGSNQKSQKEEIVDIGRLSIDSYSNTSCRLALVEIYSIIAILCKNINLVSISDPLNPYLVYSQSLGLDKWSSVIGLPFVEKGKVGFVTAPADLKIPGINAVWSLSVNYPFSTSTISQLLRMENIDSKNRVISCIPHSKMMILGIAGTPGPFCYLDRTIHCDMNSSQLHFISNLIKTDLLVFGNDLFGESLYFFDSRDNETGIVTWEHARPVSILSIAALDGMIIGISKSMNGNYSIFSGAVKNITSLKTIPFMPTNYNFDYSFSVKTVAKVFASLDENTVTLNSAMFTITNSMDIQTNAVFKLIDIDYAIKLYADVGKQTLIPSFDWSFSNHTSVYLLFPPDSRATNISISVKDDLGGHFSTIISLVWVSSLSYAELNYSGIVSTMGAISNSQSNAVTASSHSVSVYAIAGGVCGAILLINVIILLYALRKPKKDDSSKISDAVTVSSKDGRLITRKETKDSITKEITRRGSPDISNTALNASMSRKRTGEISNVGITRKKTEETQDTRKKTEIGLTPVIEKTATKENSINSHVVRSSTTESSNEMRISRFSYLENVLNDQSVFQENDISITASPTNLTTMVGTTIPLSVPGFLQMETSDYSILKKLNEGGGGEIFVAEWTNPERADTFGERPIVVKIIKDSKNMTAQDNSSVFLQEVAITNYFSRSPHCAKIYGFIMYPRTILMKMYDINLHDWIKKSTDKERSFESIVSLSTDIIAGLGVVHSANFSHNDLKPQNIFLDVNPEGKFFAVLADFGLAAPLDEILAVKAFKRIDPRGFSAQFAAPEILSRSKTPSRAIVPDELKAGDIFAYAMTLYNLATGHLPWTKLKFDEMVEAVTSGVRPDLTELVEKGGKWKPFVQIIQDSWAPDCAERPSVEYILEHLKDMDE